MGGGPCLVYIAGERGCAVVVWSSPSVFFPLAVSPVLIRQTKDGMVVVHGSTQTNTLCPIQEG